MILCLWLLPARAAEPAAQILVFGDSLSAAYGIEIEAGWVALLQTRLELAGYRQKVMNASLSGETTAGGRARLPKLLAEQDFELVILELGGNDGLRGLPLAETHANLSAMVAAAQADGAQVVLLGMRLPPNYGRTYTEAFADIYRQVAEQADAAMVPFFLDGVAGDDSLMQRDRIHPTAAAQGRMLETVWPVLQPLLRR